MAEKTKKITPLGILILQAAVVIYTTSGIFAKLADRFDVMSFRWLLMLFLELCALGTYAIVWQQIIKHFDLSLAYANRATSVFWAMIWARFIFQEGVTLKNLIGVAVIFTGIMVVNSDES